MTSSCITGFVEKSECSTEISWFFSNESCFSMYKVDLNGSFDWPSSLSFIESSSSIRFNELK